MRPYTSAAKSRLPGNAKCSMTKRYMTSLADTQHIFTDLWGIEFWIWLSPRAVSRLCARFARVRARRDYKVATLGINLSLILYTTRIQKQFPLPFSFFLLSFLLHKTRARVAMRFPAKITSSSSFIWPAIPVDWVILHESYIGMPLVRTDGPTGGRTVTWLPKVFGWVDYHIFDWACRRQAQFIKYLRFFLRGCIPSNSW